MVTRRVSEGSGRIFPAYAGSIRLRLMVVDRSAIITFDLCLQQQFIQCRRSVRGANNDHLVNADGRGFGKHVIRSDPADAVPRKRFERFFAFAFVSF